MVGAAGCGLVGAAGCTLTVGAAGWGLVWARGVIRLCPCGLDFALAVRATRSQFALPAHSLGFALTTIK